MSKNNWRIVHSEASKGWGGQEHRVLAELVGFQRRGCTVGLIAPASAEITERSEAAGVPVMTMAEGRRNFPFEALRLALKLRRDGVQIVNTHSSRDGWLVGVAARIARVPLVIRSRHIDVSFEAPWLSRHAYATLADHLITTSAAVRDRMVKGLGVAIDRTSVIPTGTDLVRFCPGGSKADLPGTGPAVGMISVLRSGKGHEIFFEAARILHDKGAGFRFFVVGGGAPEGAIEALAAAHGAEGLINFPGHREDVPELLRRLDVLAIPSMRECVPQIGLQALACGTPVVGSDVGGIPEIIRPDETGRIFPAGRPDLLAAALEAAVADTDATRRMVRAGLELVARDHGLDSMLDRLEGIYRRYLTPEVIGVVGTRRTGAGPCE